MGTTNRFTRAGEPEDYLAVVDQIRCIPRVRPRSRFRIKVAIITALGLTPRVAGVERTENRRVAYGTTFRRLAVVSISLVLSVVLFMGLSILAQGSNPGDALYFVKRAGEKMQLAFTWNPVEKAEKSLDFADRRLTELNQMVASKNIDPDNIAYLSEECERHQQAASSYAADVADDGKSATLNTHIKEIDRQKSSIKEKIVSTAGASGILEPAFGAAITVKDFSGNAYPGGSDSVSGRTDREGRFAFQVSAPDGLDPATLQTVIELDGRREVAPLVASDGRGSTEDGSYQIAIENPGTLVPLNQDVQYEAALASTAVMPVAGRTIHVKDLTSSSCINGVPSGATIRTDSEGKCSFTVKKNSEGKVSVITMVLDDGQKRDLGEVLRLGTVSRIGGSANAWGMTDSAFTLESNPPLESIKAGKTKVTLTLRKKYQKLTDYID